MCYTNCGCSCGCSATCGCYESICPSCHSCSTTTTTTTTTINPDCEPCDTFYDCECIVYSGSNVQCYGLQTGDNLCEILDVILSHLPQCSTTTTAPPLNCTFTAIASLTVPTTTSTTSTSTTSTSTSSTTSTSTSSTTSTSTSSTSTTSTTTTTTCACHTITNTFEFPSTLTVTYCGQTNSTSLSIGASSTVIACLSSYIAKAGIVVANCGTSCTTVATCTFCTTSTTTTSFCIANGFPQNAYAALFWSQGELDTSATITCDGNPVVEPSQSKSVWIAFFSDAGLTTPLATTLNNYLITVGGSPYPIGAGTTEYAYFIDYFPYSSNPVDPFTCIPGETVFESLPSLSADSCFTVVTETGIADGDMIIQRGVGDPTTNDYSADLANCLYLPGTGTPIEVVINTGQAGPITQSNIAGYCNLTIRQLVLAQAYTITIVGTANDGSSGETITVPLAISTSVNSVKNYFLDSNHSITVTINETP